MAAVLLAALAAISGGRDANTFVIHRDHRVEGFDYELLAKITARNAAKRAAMKEWDYDSETWLPVAKEKPPHPRPYKRDDSAVRAARMHRAAMRHQRQASSASTWWIAVPTPNPRCPFSCLVLPVSY
ncbi:MAG TPA: hypothetical protein VFW87_03455 [Pirellulales bacterium]|nr:hypothetical protein [Pirellulales bacterium]